MRNANRMGWTAALLVFALLVPAPHPLQAFKAWGHTASMGAAEAPAHGSASAPAQAPILMKQRIESADSRTPIHTAAVLAATSGVNAPDGDSKLAGRAGSFWPISETSRVCLGRAPPAESSL
jgi:hypothetical protein